MKTIEQVLSGYKSETLDGRDLGRLCKFLTVDQVKELGFSGKEGWEAEHKQIQFTRENILEQLKGDVSFGFEKALDRRGISSELMYEVVSMWNWILEEGLEDFGGANYAQYGLPLFKVTALKYGFENPIGEDTGSEHKYSEHGVTDGYRKI